MKNTTYQTALQLQRAGFPQPVPEFGQMWYDSGGFEALCLGRAERDKYAFIYDDRQQVFFSYLHRLTYAPTSEDILEQLPNFVRLEKFGGQRSCRIDDDGQPYRAIKETWAEACALAYLKLKATPPQPNAE